MGDRPRARVAVAIYDEERVLCLDYHSPEGQWWVLPGGGIELAEGIEEAAVRECQEEVGLKITAGEVLCVSESIRTVQHPQATLLGIHGHVVHIVLRAESWSGDVALEPNKSVRGFAWLDINTLRGLNLYPPVGAALVANAHNESEQAPYIRWTPEMRNA